MILLNIQKHVSFFFLFRSIFESSCGFVFLFLLIKFCHFAWIDSSLNVCVCVCVLIGNECYFTFKINFYEIMQINHLTIDFFWVLSLQINKKNQVYGVRETLEWECMWILISTFSSCYTQFQMKCNMFILFCISFLRLNFKCKHRSIKKSPMQCISKLFNTVCFVCS